MTNLDYNGLPYIDDLGRVRSRDINDLNDQSGLELSELLYLDNPMPEFTAAMENMLLAVIHHEGVGPDLWLAADRLRSAMFAQQASLIEESYHNA
jgi:hypothetical protein